MGLLPVAYAIYGIITGGLGDGLADYARLAPAARQWAPTISVGAPGEADSETREWAGHHPLLCIFTNETMAALFEIMGAREVVVRREPCISEGAPICRTHFSWHMGRAPKNCRSEPPPRPRRSSKAPVK